MNIYAKIIIFITSISIITYFAIGTAQAQDPCENQITPSSAIAESQYSSTLSPAKAIDGSTSMFSRWLSNSYYNSWIQVSGFQGEPVCGVAVYNGTTTQKITSITTNVTSTILANTSWVPFDNWLFIPFQDCIDTDMLRLNYNTMGYSRVDVREIAICTGETEYIIGIMETITLPYDFVGEIVDYTPGISSELYAEMAFDQYFDTEFLNKTGGIAITLVNMLNTGNIQLFGVFILLTAGMMVMLWLWRQVTETPSSVPLELSNITHTAVDVAATAALYKGMRELDGIKGIRDTVLDGDVIEGRIIDGPENQRLLEARNTVIFDDYEQPVSSYDEEARDGRRRITELNEEARDIRKRMTNIRRVTRLAHRSVSGFKKVKNKYKRV